MYQFSSIRKTIWVGLFTSMTYVVVYMAYLCSVVREFDILHGYPRADLHPGPFVSDRYTWGWYFLTFSTIKGLFPFLYLYTLVDLKSTEKRLWFDRLTGYVIFFDICLFIFFTVTICFLCNTTYNPESLCNDALDRYCFVYPDDHPDRCPPLPAGEFPIDQCELEPNAIFYRWIFFSIAFFVFDCFLGALNTDMSRYVDRFLEFHYY